MECPFMLAVIARIVLMLFPILDVIAGVRLREQVSDDRIYFDAGFY